MTFVFHDRYTATGRVPNGCDRCEGMGCVPLRRQDIRNEEEQARYDAAPPKKNRLPSLKVRILRRLRGQKPFRMADWRFIDCVECDGPKFAERAAT